MKQNKHIPSNYIDLTGHKIGKLLVLNRGVNNKHRRVQWDCLCDCGKKLTITTTAINRKMIARAKSCGCAQKDKYQLIKRRALPGIRGFNALYGSYKYQAKKRNLLFELSKDQLRAIVTKNCHFCGAVPSRIAKAHYKITIKNSEFVYNGIDRLDNTQGYVPYNLVSCCYTCNRAKSDMSLMEFRNWIMDLFNNTANLVNSLTGNLGEAE